MTRRDVIIICVPILGIMAFFTLVILLLTASRPAPGELSLGTPNDHGPVSDPPAVKADADQLSRTIITPHLEQEIAPDRNTIYCATFQIAWSQLCDYFGSDIQMADEPPMVGILNKHTVTAADLDPGSYVALAGINSPEFFDRIEQMFAKTFQSSPDPVMLNVLRRAPEGYWATYCYLFKGLRFTYPFECIETPLKFQDARVRCFGIWQLRQGDSTQADLSSQVMICDYRNDDDFIIRLRTSSRSDKLYLARIPPASTLERTLKSIKERTGGNSIESMSPGDSLKIPELDFEIFKEFAQLYGQALILKDPSRTEAPFILAAQRIRFHLNEKGATLLSEAAGAGGGASAPAPQPRRLVFDKPFLIVITRNSIEKPYFAAWIANPELLTPHGN